MTQSQIGKDDFNSNETTFIPNDVLDLQENEVMKWRKQQESFEVTHPSITVLNTVKTHGFVILSGPPGSGKSAIAYNTAFKLQKNDEFKILSVSSPEEIRKYLLPKTKQVFLIDDPVGKYTVDDSCIQRWKNEETFIKQTFTDCSNKKLILTCRSYIFKSGFNRKLNLLPVHCDLLLDGLNLSLNERRKICHRYKVKDLNDDTIVMYNFLPLLCAVFSRQEETNACFVNPYKVLTEEMINTRDKSDIAFLAIALLVVYDNNIKKQILSFENPNIKQLLNDLCDECGFKYFPSTTGLLSALCDLIGTYVQETDEVFATIHKALFENLSFVVGSIIIQCLIKYGSSEFLANRLQLASIKMDHNELIITVEPKHETKYFQRLKTDIKNGNHRDVLTGIQVKFLQFRTKLIECVRCLKAEDLKLDDNNSTPLHIVSEQGYDDLAHELIQLRKDQINHRDKHERTPLYRACFYGHDKVANELLLNDKASRDVSNIDDLTPLDIASHNGHSSTVQLLIRYGANINRKDKQFKRTALQRACENRRINVVSLLLAHNSDVKNKDINGLEAIHIACQKGFTEIVELLLQYKSLTINETDDHGRTPLFIACESNQQDIVVTLLKNKANVNKTNKETLSPLHKASEVGNENIVRWLLEASATVNAQSDDGVSPLFIASQKDKQNVVNILLNKQADLNITNKQGWTPFFISCSKGHLDICRLLLHSKANINTSDKSAFTPLHVACKDKREVIAKFLIEHNAKINAVNVKKESPLYIACMNESFYTVELLLNNNADVNLCDKHGNSPLHVAFLKGNKQIAQLLLDKNADINIQNNEKKTPISIVQGLEREKIAEMLNPRIEKKMEWRL